MGKAGRGRHARKKKKMPQKNCRQCSLFIHAPRELEEALPGLNILSSGFGCVRAETGLCKAHETLITPQAACAAYRPTDAHAQA